MDVGKAGKMVMKSEIVFNTTYETRIKFLAYLIMKKICIEKSAKLLSHSIYTLATVQGNDALFLALGTGDS